ncbi:MAG: hypothetical protein ACRD2G_04220 [Terriglobia bacterium]
MGRTCSRQLKRQNLRAPPLDVGAECWLDLDGCRGRTARYPSRLMAELHGGHRLPGDVPPRLRSAACGNKPSRMVLTDSGDDDSYGAQTH